MSRLDDVRAFYALVDELVVRVGGTRRLCECTGRMSWPPRGVYFFFEPGEERTTSGAGSRIVRVGTHALTRTSGTTLWKRLYQHRGTGLSGSGNHRGSVFRLLVGEALLRRDRRVVTTWGVDRSAGAAALKLGVTREALQRDERAIEAEVTSVIGTMPFVWVDVADAPSPESVRGIIERHSIALLSNMTGRPIDPASSRWLGSHSARRQVRTSGLWNIDHVDESYDPAFLHTFDAAIRATKRL